MQRSLLHQLTFTVPFRGSINDINDLFFDILGFHYHITSHKLTYSKYLYKDVYSLQNEQGKTLITVYANGFKLNNNTVCFDVSGLVFENGANNPLCLDVQRLASKILEYKGQASNLHLALDDLDQIIPYDELYYLSSEEVFRDRLKTPLCRASAPYAVGSIGPGQSIYYGQRTNNHICIYRKDREMGVKFPWIRVEMRLRRKDDTKRVLERLAAGEYVGKIAADFIGSYLDFKQPGARQLRYRKTMPWWSQFLADAEKIKFAEYRKQPKPISYSPVNRLRLNQMLDKLKQFEPEIYAQFMGERVENDSVVFR